MKTQTFDRDGYQTIKLAIPKSELVRWSELVDRRGTALARNVLADEDARALARSEAVRACVAPILGPGAECVRGLLFDKQKGHNWAVAWHQDTVIPVVARPTEDIRGYTSWSVKGGVPHVRPPAAILEGMVSVRINLDPANETSGTLKVLPGSHVAGILDEEGIARMRAKLDRRALAVDAGDVVLMRPLLLHASSKAESPSQRRVVHLEFTSASLPEGLAWQRWSR